MNWHIVLGLLAVIAFTLTLLDADRGKGIPFGLLMLALLVVFG